VAIHPAASQHERGEAHADLEGNSGLLGQNPHRARLRGGRQQTLKRGDHLGFSTCKVILQPHVAAEMRLVPIRKATAAFGTDPQRLHYDAHYDFEAWRKSGS
jgi:hypothetical protein